MGLQERFEPFEAPFQWTHYPIFIARGEPGFPIVHPTRVLFPEHVLSSSLPVPAITPLLTCIDDEPKDIEQWDGCDNPERDYAIQAPDAEYIALNVGQIQRKCKAGKRSDQDRELLAGKTKPQDDQISEDSDQRNGNAFDHGIGTVIHDPAIPLLVDGAGTRSRRVM